VKSASTARSAVTVAGRLVIRHKVISAVVALFAVAVLAVSLATTGAAAPRQYPAAHGFALPVLDKPGQRISLSQYQGQPVVINFFASWCEPCQRETPLLASWYKQQHGHVVMLGLDENDVTANAVKFAQAKGVSYPIGFDPNLTVPSAYGVDGLPQTFFLNAQHRIVDHVLGAVTQADLTKGVRLMKTAG
jgi:cytochrome c biogenesis protein CcmG, thiol:disulfide interchange protein DsbE